MGMNAQEAMNLLLNIQFKYITKSEHHEKKITEKKEDRLPSIPGRHTQLNAPFPSHILGACIIESVHRGVSTAFMKNCGRKEGLDT